MTTAQAEKARVTRHLEGALAQLLAADTAHLDAEQRTRRAGLAAHLRGYIDAGRFPVNRTDRALTPVFVDATGTRCAVASMLDATGETALVQEVAAHDNLARVHDLAALPALGAWLGQHGLSVDEAARVQPSYAAMEEVRTQPTVSVVAQVSAGASTEHGRQLAFAPGVRVGIRRRVHAQTSSGTVRYGGSALMAEYSRSLVLDQGAAHHLALLAQWEPLGGGTSDAQWYLLAGLVGVIDGNASPGPGFGGRLGTGFSFRGRSLPFLGEVSLQGLAQGGALSLRVGLTLGVGW